jgi:hypothetical protein
MPTHVLHHTPNTTPLHAGAPHASAHAHPLTPLHSAHAHSQIGFYLPQPPSPPFFQGGFDDVAVLGTKKVSRLIRASYLELWDRIVRESHAAEVLWDQWLIDKLKDVLVALNT